MKYFSADIYWAWSRHLDPGGAMGLQGEDLRLRAGSAGQAGWPRARGAWSLCDLQGFLQGKTNKLTKLQYTFTYKREILFTVRREITTDSKFQKSDESHKYHKIQGENTQRSIFINSLHNKLLWHSPCRVWLYALIPSSHDDDCFVIVFHRETESSFSLSSSVVH